MAKQKSKTRVPVSSHHSPRASFPDNTQEEGKEDANRSLGDPEID